MGIQTAPVEWIRHDSPFPRYIDNRVLGATAETVTVPAGITFMDISVTATCYIKTGGTAATPNADVADGTGNFVLHASQDKRYNMKGVATFSIIGIDGTIVAMAFFADKTDGV